MVKFKIGDKVKYIGFECHCNKPRWYPAVGTEGTVIEVSSATIFVDWGNAEGVASHGNGKKTWWCDKNDVVKLPITLNATEAESVENCTDTEIWEMLKPKMHQFAPSCIENMDSFSPVVKDMVVAAYRSGYGRATKGRSFMIKPKVKKAIEKPCIDDSIDAVLGSKMIVTFYKGDNSYKVANFAYSRENGKDVEIYADIVYCSASDSWTFGFDILSDPDCEMYVAVPFSEVVGKFDSESIKALYCGDKLMALNGIKPWAIGKFDGALRFSNETRAFMKFKHEEGNAQFYPEIHDPKFKALVPICDYLRENGVNV